MNRGAVILLSGGLDSATVLALAREQEYTCSALSFRYGQRHGIELEAAKRTARSLSAHRHLILELPLGELGGSALTDEQIAVPESPGTGIPVTYVPARNTVFLAYALAYAETLEISDIFIGVNALDYSGYPDCRPEYIEAFERMANLATRAGIEGKQFRIHAPLIKMTKAEIIRTGTDLGVDYSLTVSCYQPGETGEACGACDSCRLRRKGFAEADIPDPTRYRYS